MFWFWCSESWKKVLYDWFVRCDGMIAMHYRSYVQNTLLDSLQVSYCIFQFQNCMKREQTNVWMYLSINASYFSSSIFMRRFLTSKLYGNASEQFLTSHSPIGLLIEDVGFLWGRLIWIPITGALGIFLSSLGSFQFQISLKNFSASWPGWPLEIIVSLKCWSKLLAPPLFHFAFKIHEANKGIRKNIFVFSLLFLSARFIFCEL